MFRRILVPIDGSELSERTLPLALEFADTAHGELLLATVIDMPSGPGFRSERELTGFEGDASVADVSKSEVTEQADFSVSTRPGDARPVHHSHSPDRIRAIARDYLEDTARAIRTDDRQVSTFVAAGDAASEIAAIAEREGADLIAMATRGRSGMVRGLLGSVADRVLHIARVPVLIVRPETAPKRGEPVAPIQNLIVPVDGSEMSEAALTYATPLARGFGAALHLTRSVRYPGVYSADVTYGYQSGEVFNMKEMEDQAETYLRSLSDRLKAEGIEVQHAIGRGHPRTHIVELATNLADAVVVMCTRGASGMPRWVMGSVADSVLRTAAAPTLVIPPAALQRTFAQ